MSGLGSFIMCREEGDCLLQMRLLAGSATKWSTTQKADFVPGHKIGEFLQGRVIEGAARVERRCGEAFEGQVTVFGLDGSLNSGSHGNSPYEVVERECESGHTLSAPAQKVC
jgi:hypothetical protein